MGNGAGLTVATPAGGGSSCLAGIAERTPTMGTTAVSGSFSEEEAATIADALEAGDERTLELLLKGVGKHPTDLAGAEEQQAIARRSVCGDCTCSAGRAVKTCQDQVLVERGDLTRVWVTVGIRLERCGFWDDFACFLGRVKRFLDSYR
jgi:hypothetical protein